jgi:hypothetical protein
MAVQTLAPTGGYPDSEWDFAAISFRADGDERPRLATATLPLTEGCDQCHAAAGALAAALEALLAEAQ